MTDNSYKPYGHSPSDFCATDVPTASNPPEELEEGSPSTEESGSSYCSTTGKFSGFRSAGVRAAFLSPRGGGIGRW